MRYLLLLLPLCLSCQPTERLEVSERVDLLVKDTSLFSYFWLDYDGIAFYASPEEKKLEQVETKLFFHEFADFQSLANELPAEELLRIYHKKGTGPFPKEAEERLQTPGVDLVEEDVKNPVAGKRIVLDPILMEQPIRFDQGDSTLLQEPILTWAVVKIMEAKLKKLNASVMITRALEDAGEPPAPESMARSINSYRPDITLSIRLHVREEGQVLKPLPKNYCLVFVPGAFMKKDLEAKQDRMELLRLMSGQDAAESMRLGVALVRTFGTDLGVPPIESADAKAFEKYTVYASSGVYSRNLALNRLVHSPVCYTVPLCIDTEGEFVLWAKKEVKVGNIVASKRAEQVADAYIEALQSFFGASGADKPVTADDLIEEEVK